MYVTQAQLESRFAAMQWWTDDAAAGSIDADIVAEIIENAEGEIDRYAAQQYSTPLTLSNASTEKVIRKVAGDIAGYLLASRLREDNIPENLRKQYETTIEWLKDLAAGKVFLQGESAAEATKPGGGIVSAGDEAILTRDSMDGL